MNFLLFFISSIFSFIFFVFYKLNQGGTFFGGEGVGMEGIESISGNLLIETTLFIILALFFFFSFSNYQLLKRNKEIPIVTKNKKNLFGEMSIMEFIKKHIYYLGFIFFYTSIYLILNSLGIKEFNYLILFLNIIIGALFFITKKAELFRDFIKINTILFSLYYIFVYILSFVLGLETLNSIDFVNTICIFSFFIITFYSDSKILKKAHSDSPLVLYFFLYSFIVFSFYGKKIFLGIGIDFIQIFIYIGVLFNIFIYFFLQKMSFFSNSKYILRALSFLYLYISMIFSMFYLLAHFSDINFIGIFIVLILLYGVVFNYLVHRLFQNYVSFIFSLIGVIFMFYFFMIKYLLFISGDIVKGVLVLSLTISFFLIVFTYLYKLKYIIDNYFLHFCAYFVNFLGIAYYFVYADFEILNFGIILLLDSILIFLSYFKLKKIKYITD